ncbi:MAG: hypothetical protein WCA06_01385, partial [Terrimicrobiaceae bacterium]
MKNRKRGFSNPQITQIDADGEKGSARVPRAISGVSPGTLFGETRNTTRRGEPRWPHDNVASRGEDAYAPQTP